MTSKTIHPTAGAEQLVRLAQNVMAAIAPTVPVQMLGTFMMVGLHEGKSLTELADLIGANISTASRHLLELGERGRNKEPGYGLVESRNDPMNLRVKQYSLTPRGKLLWRTYNQLMQEA